MYICVSKTNCFKIYIKGYKVCAAIRVLLIAHNEAQERIISSKNLKIAIDSSREELCL
jgi:hypothetical protein